jgi:anti-sigma factor RsiW
MVDCKRVEEWVPLYVEGDLREPQASQLRAHAQTCQACGALVAEYESSQAWLRADATPVFDEAFIDTIRAGVMREITATRTRRPFVERLRDWVAPRRVALITAALMLIFVALALLIYLSRPRVNHQDEVTAEQRPAPPVQKEVERTPVVANDHIDPQPKRTTTHRIAHTLAKRAQRDLRRTQATPDSALAQAQPPVLPVDPVASRNAAAPGEERLRIEIQTADPNIRIIWFAPKPTETDAP